MPILERQHKGQESLL